MKRICILLCICMLLPLLSCAKGTPEEAGKEGDAGENTTAVPTEETGMQTPPPVNTTPLPFENHPTTLMIYLIGSDLEAKTGAGTSDLEEIASSGVDLSRNNILIYAGGSPHWHSEPATETANTILHLTQEGYLAEATFGTRSMGEADCLADFVNYAVEHYPAEHYALILWDHGNGPVIGYGKDMLYGNDTLTLSEMRTAMEKTPFAGELSLDWVGFDACLMASAELACVWGSYADYLVASQEIEPSFGWAYGFLSGLGVTDTESLLSHLASEYMNACLAYYEKRGYEGRDTTIAVMDLSKTEELHNAVNALFAAAAKDVSEDYNELAARRVGTRALGRASTGSEYDLVDLRDMAKQLEAQYPAEAAALLDSIDSMVVTNTTNAEGLCGLSLYYPFFNKPYYQSSWAETYEELGVFADYLTYLKGYEQSWLNDDMLSEFSQSVVPTQVTNEQFTLQLTPEQAEHFASARYYILQQEGVEAYTKIFSSDEVTLENGVLTAHFDGNVIYGMSDYGEVFLPVTVQHDSVGTKTHYSAPVVLNNDVEYLFGAEPDNYQRKVAFYRFHLVLDRAAGTVDISALLPEEEDAGSILAGGKTDDADLSKWTEYWFNDERHRTLTRYENGVIKPVDDWYASVSYTAVTFPISDGVEFIYAPLAYGNYVLIFEIQDTQGSRYCSEPLPVELGKEPDFPERKIPLPEPMTVRWPENTDELTIYDKDGIRLIAEITDDSWHDGKKIDLRIENGTDRNVYFFGTDLTCNGNIYCDDGYAGYLYGLLDHRLDAWGMDPAVDSINFGSAGETGQLSDLRSISFYFTLQDCDTLERFVHEQRLTIEFARPGIFSPAVSDMVASKSITAPIAGAFAASQVLYEDGDLRVSLQCLGKNTASEYYDDDLRGTLCFENLSNHMLHLNLDGIVLNNVFLSAGMKQVDLPAGCTGWRSFFVKEDDLEIAGITSIASVKLCLLAGEGMMTTWMGYGETLWLPVELSQHASSPSVFPAGEITLYSENGVRLAMWSASQGDAFDPDWGSGRWYLTLENNSDKDISLEMTDKYLDSTPIPDDSTALYLIDSDTKLAPGQCRVIEINLGGEVTWTPDTARFRLRVLNFTSSAELWLSAEPIELHTR